MAVGPGGGQDNAATRPERRLRDPDRRRAAQCRLLYPFGIGTKTVNRYALICVLSPRYRPIPETPFQAEPLHFVQPPSHSFDCTADVLAQRVIGDLSVKPS
jgi:hypothetical protein